jgi:leucyl-tRNA synthetase
VRVTDDEPDAATLHVLHRTIDGVRRDMAGLRLNTAVAKLIELTNALTKLPTVPRLVAEPLVLMLAPLAPHVAEEMWSLLGHEGSLAYEPFPVADPALAAEATVTSVVQVAGKVRHRLEVSPGISEEDLLALALAAEPVQRALAGREVRTVVVRAPKLVNVVPA